MQRSSYVNSERDTNVRECNAERIRIARDRRGGRTLVVGKPDAREKNRKIKTTKITKRQKIGKPDSHVFLLSKNRFYKNNR